MNIKFIQELSIYLLAMLMVAYGFNAVDFSKYIKQGKIIEARVLIVVLLCVFSYLIGNFIIFLLQI